ncbi:MAG TPA: glycosyltransferase [Patescibacteria group bacterium]|nr:glycosyltransferase [Patescibacteria group bacterium]
MIYIYLPAVPAEPIGGIQTLFDYANTLNGMSGKTIATIVSKVNYIRQILPRSYPLVPVLYKEPELVTSDILVFPEVLLESVDKYPTENKKYLAVLNWQYFEFYTKRLKRPMPRIEGILTNSQFAKDKIEKVVDVPVFAIPHIIDANFSVKNSFAKREPNSILILNRKNTHHIGKILSFLQALPHKVTIVNNVTPTKLAKLYNEHQIFISLGYPEGFGRPAAEAMACGCVVVGFTGGGGSDFMSDGFNSFTAKDSNEDELLQKLSHVLHRLNIQQKSDISALAAHTIKSRYNPKTQSNVIGAIFAKDVGKTIKILKTAKSKAVTPLYAASSKETLEISLFHERQKYQDIVSSKYFKIWQSLSSLRSIIPN